MSEIQAESTDQLRTRPAEERSEPVSWRGQRDWLAKAAVAAALLGWAYAPNFRGLARLWSEDPDYSHGYLVIPVALAILWRMGGGPIVPRSSPSWWGRAYHNVVALWQDFVASWRALIVAGSSPSWWGWVVVIAALVARAIFYEAGKTWLETATFLPVIAGLVIALGGWPLFSRSWPAIAYLGFMLPLPPGLNTLLSQPLQRLATRGSCFLLRLSGLWVIAEGNVIDLGDSKLEVATACNGLSMLMCLAATVAAMVLLVSMPLWKRLVLLASIIPIALLSNVLRITATGWCYHLFGAGRGAEFAHDAAGWLMMPTALVLVGLELALLSWFFVQAEEEKKTSLRDSLLLGRR